MPKIKQTNEQWLLFEVVTVPEACDLWGKPRQTVILAIDTARGRDRDLVYRKAGGVWLITTRSLIRRWGPPVHKRPEYPFLHKKHGT